MEPPTVSPPRGDEVQVPIVASRKRKAPESRADLSSFFQQIRDVAGAGPDKFKEKAGILLGREVIQARDATSVNLAEIIHFLKESCDSHNLSIENASTDNIAHFVQDLNTIKIYLQDPRFKNDDVAKSLIDDIKSVKHYFANKEGKKKADGLPKVFSALSPEKQIKMLLKQGYITKEVIEAEGLTTRHLIFAKGLENTLDDGMLKALLEALPPKFLDDVQEFDFSCYPRLSAQAPGLIAKYCPRLLPDSLQSLGKDARFFDIEVKVGDSVMRTNRGLLVQQSSEMKEFIEEFKDVPVEFSFPQVDEEAIKNFIRIVNGQVDLEKLAVDQLVEIAKFADRFACQKMVTRCSDALLFPKIRGSRGLDVKSIHYLLSLNDKLRGIEGLKKFRQDLSSRTLDLLSHLFEAELQTKIALLSTKPTDQEFGDLYYGTLLEHLTMQKQQYPSSCVRDIYYHLKEYPTRHKRAIIGGSEEPFKFRVNESRYFVEMIQSLEQLAALDGLDLDSHERIHLFCFLGSVYSAGIPPQIPVDANKADSYFLRAIQVGQDDKELDLSDKQLPYVHRAQLYLHVMKDRVSDALAILNNYISSYSPSKREEFFLLLVDHYCKTAETPVKNPIDFFKTLIGQRPEPDFEKAKAIIYFYMQHDQMVRRAPFGMAMRAYSACLALPEHDRLQYHSHVYIVNELLNYFSEELCTSQFDRFCLLIAKVCYASAFPGKILTRQAPKEYLAELVADMEERAKDFQVQLRFSPAGPIIQELLQKARKLSNEALRH